MRVQQDPTERRNDNNQSAAVLPPAVLPPMGPASDVASQPVGRRPTVVVSSTELSVTPMQDVLKRLSKTVVEDMLRHYVPDSTIKVLVNRVPRSGTVRQITSAHTRSTLQKPWRTGAWVALC